MPTPTGVPVAMMSPGNNVVVALMVAIRLGMSKIRSATPDLDIETLGFND